MTKPNQMRRDKLFSLIELMLVVSVLAVLSSLFYPSISRALRMSQHLNCFEHEKLIGQAFTLYVEDHVKYPLFRSARSTSPDPTRQHTVFWDDLLGMGYDGRNLSQSAMDSNGLFNGELKGSDIYACPLDDSDGRTAALPSSKNLLVRLQEEGRARSYGMNSYRANSNVADAIKEGITGVAYGTQTSQGVFLPWSQSPHNIPDPSQVLMLLETPGWGFVGAGGSSAKATPLSQDGQLEADRLKSLGVAIKSFENIRFHNGGWNYLFVDGHVENLLPEDTVAKHGDISNPKGGYWTIDPND